MSEFAIDVAQFAAHGSDPGATANAGKFYSKNISGTVHEFFQASDGTVYQLSPVTGSPQSVPYSALSIATFWGTGKTWLNQTGTQNVFNALNDTITLAASTTYRFRGLYLTTRASAVASQWFINFTGTATYTTFEYTLYGSATDTGQANYYLNRSTSNTPSLAVVAAGLSNTALSKSIRFEGMCTVNASGTFIPSTSFSVSPGATNLTEGSYLEIVATGTAAIGGWV